MAEKMYQHVKKKLILKHRISLQTPVFERQMLKFDKIKLRLQLSIRIHKFYYMLHKLMAISCDIGYTMRH